MIKGLRTCLYPAPDLAKAKAWYQLVFQRKPYFDEPFYVGFDVGGFELGLVPDDIEQEVKRLRAARVTTIGEVQDVGGGIKVVDIHDPFGNLVGLIENPHFKTDKVQLGLTKRCSQPLTGV